MNITGLAVPQTTKPLTKLPVKLASPTLKPIPSSAISEPNVFSALLHGAINKKTAPLPSVDTPVSNRTNKSSEPKNEKQSKAPAGDAIVFELPHFTLIAARSNDSRNDPGNEQGNNPPQTRVGKQSIPVQDEPKPSAQPSQPYQATSIARALTPDVAFGLRLTKNQPAADDAVRVAPDSPTSNLPPTALPPTADGSSPTKAVPDPSPATPLNQEVAAVFTADSGTRPEESKHAIRPETSSMRTPAAEREIPPAPEKHTTDGNSSGNPDTQQKDSAQPAAPKQNQATVAHADDHLQAVTASQLEIAHTADPQAIHSATNLNDSRKVASDPEINPVLQTQPARQISLKLTGPDSTKVDLLLTERAGKMQIAVRTGDHALAKSMQTDLTELVGRLENKGFKAEAWIPTSHRQAEAVAAPQPSSQSNRQNQQEQPGGSGQQQQRQGQNQNQSNQRQQANWKAQMEETASIEQTRTQNI